MIISSFQMQYGMRIYSEVFKTVSWDEFKALICGISPDTPLGRMVSIRAEEDKDILKVFTRDQKRIRNEWRNRSSKKMDADTYEEEMKSLEAIFASICS